MDFSTLQKSGMKEQINKARRLIQALSQSQDEIFKDLIEELGVSSSIIEDKLFDYLFNGYENDVEDEARMHYGMTLDEFLGEDA